MAWVPKGVVYMNKQLLKKCGAKVSVFGSSFDLRYCICFEIEVRICFVIPYNLKKLFDYLT